MEVLGLRAPGLRRAARSRLVLAALVGGLYLAAGVAATWPAVQDSGSKFLAGGAPGYGEAAPGDHLQSNYRLWLVGHQLEHGRAPWIDPYTFRPEAKPLLNFAGWPFGLPYWPLHGVFGDVGAWNAFVLLTYLLSGLFAFLWLRTVELGTGASLVGGLAFALAPYRVDQSAGHMLGPVSMLLPFALWALERGRRGSRWWLALSAAATASIPLSGQVHLALGTTAFVLLYALVRVRERWALAAVAAAVAGAVAAGLFYQHEIVAGSIEAGGRSLGEVSAYSAQLQDFFARHERHGSESFVFLGWATPLAALVGLWLLARARRWGLVALLLVGIVVPCLLALGTNLPLYSELWHAFSPFRYPRVPERLMPVACLCIAALVAVAAARLSRYWLVGLALVALVFDLHFNAYTATAAGAETSASAALRSRPPGRLLELPVFLPDVNDGSVYLYADMSAQRQRPEGYALGPRVTDTIARRLRPLNCGDWSDGTLVRRLGVGYVAVHGGLFAFANSPGEWFAWRALTRHGYGPIAQRSRVTMFAQGGGATVGTPPEPSRGKIVLCDGWRRGVLSIPPGELWAYGPGRVSLRLHATATALVSAQGRRLARVRGTRTVSIPLRGRRWHLVRVDSVGPGEIDLVSAHLLPLPAP